MKYKILMTSALGAALAGAFPGATAAQKKEDIILAELRQIQAQLAQLQTSQAALKSVVEEISLGANEQQDAMRKTLADSRIAFERLQQDVSILSERIEETNMRIGSLREEMVSLHQSREPLTLPPATPADEGQQAGAETPPAGEGEETPAPPAVVAPGPNVIDVYNQARNDYTQGRYALAISGFAEVLELDQRGDLADNAHYWMGESYLAQRRYDQALGEFDRIIRDYPESNKRPDAYLKKAMTLEEMGRRAEANVMYELVIEQFPRTNQERVARRRLEELMKSTPPRPQQP